MNPSLLNPNNTEEELLKINQERSLLLAMGHEISLAKTKDKLLSIIDHTLKKLFAYDDSVVCLINEDQQTHSAFLYNEEETFKKYPGSEAMATMKFSVNDGIYDAIDEAGDIIYLELEEIAKLPCASVYVPFWIAQGMKQLVGVPLKIGTVHFGCFSFYTKRRNSIPREQFSLLYGICAHIAIAIQNINANELIEKNNFEKSIILEICNSLALAKDRNDIARVVSRKLHLLLPFNYCFLSLSSSDNQQFACYTIQSPLPPQKGTGDYTCAEVILSNEMRQFLTALNFPTVSSFSAAEHTDPIFSFFKDFINQGNGELAVVSLSEGIKLIGFLTLFSASDNTYNSNHLNLLEGAASQLTTASANILARENIQKQEQEKSFLLSFSNHIVTVRDITGLKTIISKALKDLFRIRAYLITVKHPDNKSFNYFLHDLPESDRENEKLRPLLTDKFPIRGTLSNLVLNSEEPMAFDVREILRSKRYLFPEYPFLEFTGAKRILGIRLKVGNEDIGILWIEEGKVNSRLVMGISAQIAIALSNALANASLVKQFEEIQQYKRRLEVENTYLLEKIDTNYNHSEIVGSGAEMQKVFLLLSQVAYANTTVLILGETGTGKELIARAIHNSSSRKDKLMVKVNCAVFPPHLIESELFGHEKGSFTGAYEQKAGKFELANNGTLFLDEVGEMPMELQVKILRALQEREIERVGGKKTIKINVRIIAATNRDLHQEVQEGRFRSDLYYRLNVFPITMPSLRKHPEDIPLLVEHFIRKFSRNAGKAIKSVSPKVLQELQEYPWPGNIRELEHMIERSLLLSTGNVIKNVYLPSAIQLKTEIRDDSADKTIDQIEREHIIKVLRKCNGKIFGEGGAADILGIPSSTLNSKMKKHNIKKNKSFNNE